MAVSTRGISSKQPLWWDYRKVIASLSHCYFPYVGIKYPKIQDEN